MNQGIRRIQFPSALNLLEGLSPFQWETRFNQKEFQIGKFTRNTGKRRAQAIYRVP